MDKKKPATVHATFFLAAIMLWSIGHTPVQPNAAWPLMLLSAVFMMVGFRKVLQQQRVKSVPVRIRTRESRILRKGRKF